MGIADTPPSPRNRSMKQLLIKWSDLDKDLATWEDANAIV
jgi:hypothetical protein